MTKLSVCDVCLAEGKMQYAKWRTGWKGSVKVDLCKTHKDYLKGKTKTDALKLLADAEGFFLRDENL